MRRCEKRAVLANTQSVIDMNEKCQTLLDFLIHKDMGPDLNRELWAYARLLARVIFEGENLRKRVQRETPYEELSVNTYVIPTRTEENNTLLDMIENALDLELANQKEMFVLYDDAGKLALKNIANMKLDLLVDAETGENFEYSSSIDEQTYDQIKLAYDNEKTGKREIFIAKDSSHINEWGILQYFDTLKEGENGAAKANALLSLYNSKTRRLKITKAFGDIRVRAGCLIVVSLDLGDMVVNSYMLVEKAVHIFNESEHFMNLTLRGGEFVA